LAHESFSISEVIPASPDLIYSAWLDTTAHSAFTGDEASVEPFVGGRHTSFGGYAEGTTLELSPGRRIVQTWRSKDFPDGTPDSRLEVTLEETLGGTMVTIQHTEIPSGQGERYREGWVKYYLQALKQYFAGQSGQGDETASEDDGDDDDEDTAVVVPAEAPAAVAHPASRNGAARPHRAAATKKKPAVKAKAKAKAKGKAKVAARKPAARTVKKAAKNVAAAARKRPAAKTARAKPKAKAQAKAKAAKKKPAGRKRRR